MVLGGRLQWPGASALNHWFYLASEGSGTKVVKGRFLHQPGLQRLDRDRHRSRQGRPDLVPHPDDVPHLEQHLRVRSEGDIKSTKDLFGVASPECKGIASSLAEAEVHAEAPSVVVPVSQRPDAEARSCGVSSVRRLTDALSKDGHQAGLGRRLACCRSHSPR